MLLREYTRVIIIQVLSHYVTHLLCLDGVDFCLFSVNFCQSILILDVDYVLFTKQIALEISSCGRDQFPGKTKQNPKFYLGHAVPGQIETITQRETIMTVLLIGFEQHLL